MLVLLSGIFFIMRTISFTVYKQPLPQKRHRTRRVSYGAITYDPSSNDKRNFLYSCIQYKPKAIPVQPVKIELSYYLKRPKFHYSGKKQEKLKANAPKRHTTKPDIDNLIKFTLDAMSKHFWYDDKQVISVIATKDYAEIGEKERTVVKINYHD